MNVVYCVVYLGYVTIFGNETAANDYKNYIANHSSQDIDVRIEKIDVFDSFSEDQILDGGDN